MALGSPIRQAQGRLPEDAGMWFDSVLRGLRTGSPRMVGNGTRRASGWSRVWLGMCSGGWSEVFSFWANVFSFGPDVFTFQPNVFSSEGHVFSEDEERRRLGAVGQAGLPGVAWERWD